MYKPFDFQEEAIVKGLEVLTDKKGKKSVIVAPTAAGKSVIIAEIVNRLPKNGNILIVQPNKELLEQNVSKIETLGISPAIFSASLKKKNIGRITYATPMSLKTEHFVDKNIKYLLIDEADLGTQSASKLKLFMKGLDIKSVLGFTATPIYLKTEMGGSKLKIMTQVKDKFFSDISHVIQISDMIKAKRWSKIIYEQHDFNSKGLIINTSGSDFTEKSIADNFVEAENSVKILSILKTIPKDESVLIFVPGVENVVSLQKKIPNSVALTYLTDDETRKEYIEGFKNGKYQVLINSVILTAGFDYPNLRHIIDAYPTKSARIYMQKIGRLVRVYKTKLFGTYHDISGNYESFGKVEDINFEFIEGFGWGMFTGEKLLTLVRMTEVLSVTKDIIKQNPGEMKKKLNMASYNYLLEQNNNGNVIITFGKYKGKTVKDVYKENKQYLQWLVKKETKFKFDFVKNGSNIQRELYKLFKA